MSEQWRGIFKLLEEMGELQQVLGKLGPFPDGEHPDGEKHLSLRLCDELADVLAAIRYFIEINNLDLDKIMMRTDIKLDKFVHWGLTGLLTAQPVDTLE